MERRARKAPRAHRQRGSEGPAKVTNLLQLAKTQGLLEGSRDTLVRGRMPQALVAKAKTRTGIQSDSKLIEVALANLAVADDYGEWLLSQRGKVPPDFDLEF